MTPPLSTGLRSSTTSPLNKFMCDVVPLPSHPGQLQGHTQRQTGSLETWMLMQMKVKAVFFFYYQACAGLGSEPCDWWVSRGKMWNTTFSIWHGPISCVTGKYSFQFIVTHGSYVQNNWPRDELFICWGVFQVLVLVLPIIILRYDRHQCTTLYYCKDPNKWIWMIFSQTGCEFMTVSTHLIAKHHQRSSLRAATRTSLSWRDDPHRQRC